MRSSVGSPGTQKTTAVTWAASRALRRGSGAIGRGSGDEEGAAPEGRRRRRGPGGGFPRRRGCGRRWRIQMAAWCGARLLGFPGFVGFSPRDEASFRIIDLLGSASKFGVHLRDPKSERKSVSRQTPDAKRDLIHRIQRRFQALYANPFVINRKYLKSRVTDEMPCDKVEPLCLEHSPAPLQGRPLRPFMLCLSCFRTPCGRSCARGAAHRQWCFGRRGQRRRQGPHFQRHPICRAAGWSAALESAATGLGVDRGPESHRVWRALHAGADFFRT